MSDDTDEAICDDGNMYLNAHGIFRFSPKGLDLEMLFDLFEEQLNLPPILVEKCNILGFKIEVVGVVGEGTLELWRVVSDAPDGCRIIRLVSLAGEANSLVTKDIILSFLKVITALNLIGGMKLLSNNKERTRAIDFIESCKVKVPSIKYIARKRLVCKPIHRVDIMYLSIGDSVEYRNLRDNVNLGVDSYAGLGRSELSPSENGEAKVNRSGVNRIESSMQFKLSGETLRLGNRHHVECNPLKDPIVPDGISLREDLSIDNSLSKTKEKRFVSMSDCNISKFPKASASKQLSEHKNQQMAPESKRPALCPVVVLGCQTFEVPLREKLGYLRKNIVTSVHICSNFDLDAKVHISKVRQDFQILCCCA